MEIIVSDLTRFNPKEGKVCIAGYSPGEYNTLVRPMPYLSVAFCEKLGLLPGAILQGDFKKASDVERPHVEDHIYTDDKLKFVGPCSAEQFHEMLEKSCFPSISEGFDNKVNRNDKVISPKDPPSRSIVTIKVNYEQIELFRDNYGKDKVHINDNNGREYKYIPISDLGFARLLESHRDDDSYLDRIDEFMQSQDEIFLRIGLTRYHESQGENSRAGYWMQLNGLYTFPCFSSELRGYA